MLELLELRGAVVTIDAMGTQRPIAAQEADYVLGLKGNQGTLHEEVALLFDEQHDGFAGHTVSEHRSCQKDHGRLETKRVVATEQIAWLQDNHDWPGLRSIAKVESLRELIVEGQRGKSKRRRATTSARCRPMPSRSLRRCASTGWSRTGCTG